MAIPSEKATIAVDIDDVLAYNAEGFTEYSNRRWGTQLSSSDYNEHLAALWRVDEAELKVRMNDFLLSGAIGQYRANEAAAAVLRELHKEFRLIVITSRRLRLETETLTWLSTHFSGLFDEVHFAGIWDDTSRHSSVRAQVTKADLCQSLGANYLIDDQLKHCVAAAACGVKALLFGEYSWNKHDNLPDGVTAVADWAAVKDYFDATRQ